MNKLYRYCIVLLFAVAGATPLFAQNDSDDKKKEKEAKVASLVESKNYVFVAQSMMPLTGRNIQLTSRYDLVVAGDTVRSELPYWGRAYVAPIGSFDNGIRFKATDVKYSAKQKKEGVWEVLIEPKGGQDVRQMYLTITGDGYASLRVNSNNRQSISYRGYITARS